MEINAMNSGRQAAWVAQGWSLFWRDRGLWLAMTLIYLAIALALQQIPFIGYLVLVLVTPLLAAGAWAAVEAEAGGPGKNPAFVDRVRTLFVRAARQLFQVLFDPARTLPIMVIATMALGGAVIIQILAQMLKVGGAALPAFADGSVGASIWVPALLSLLAVSALELLLVLISLFAVYLVVTRDETPLTALETAARSCVSRWRRHALLALLFLVPLMVLGWVSPVAQWALALALLPVFMTTSLATFEELALPAPRR